MPCAQMLAAEVNFDAWFIYFVLVTGNLPKVMPKFFWHTMVWMLPLTHMSNLNCYLNCYWEEDRPLGDDGDDQLSGVQPSWTLMMESPDHCILNKRADASWVSLSLFLFLALWHVIVQYEAPCLMLIPCSRNSCPPEPWPKPVFSVVDRWCSLS